MIGYLETMLKIDINGGEKIAADKKRAIKDLIRIYESNLYINEKGYLNKLVDLLWGMGYYINNETIFKEQ